MERLSGVPRTLKLQYTKPRPQLDANKNIIPDKFEEGKYDEYTQEVKLVLPGEGWTMHALDLGEILAAQHKIFAHQANMDEADKKATSELGSSLYMTHNHFHAQVLSLYYINQEERVYIDQSGAERIYAFENSLPVLTEEQEDLIYEDFFGYFKHSPNSIRRALKGIQERQHTPELTIVS